VLQKQFYKQLKSLNMNKFHWIYILFFVPFFSEAQQVYKGDYRFNGIEGEATFNYRTGPEESTIKEGDFEFERREKDTEDGTIFYKTRIKGVYNNDLKNGLWDYLDERHQVTLVDVSEFKVLSELSSRQIKLKANYATGLPHGRWIFEENGYAEGKLGKRASAENLNFRQGDLFGKFEYKAYAPKHTYFIRGELKEGGFMNGEWVFVYESRGKVISEVRKYEDGFLLGIVKRDLEEDEVIEEIVYFETIDKLTKVNNKQNKRFRVSDEKFAIFFNDGVHSAATQLLAQRDANAFISSFLINVLRYDEAFVSREGELIDLPLHTRRFVFELSRNDQRIVEDLPGKFDRINTVVQEYATRNALNLNRQKSDSLAFAHAFFQYQAEKMNNIEELIELFRSKEIQYYDVQHLSREGLPFMTATDSIVFSYDDNEYVRPINYKVENLESQFFGTISSFVSQLDSVTNSVRAMVDNSLSIIERDEDLRNFESEVINRQKRVEELYSDFTDVNFNTRQVLENIRTNILKGNFERLNERYAKEESFAGKKETANVMLDLLTEMEEQYVRVNEFWSKNEKVDALYLEEIFNPFTFTRYDQRAKSRLYEAYEKLFEHYIDRLKAEQDYAQIKNWSRKIDALQSRIVDLREAETRTLERRLNKRISISKVESLMGL
jgi:hypothetical protein